jgi:hypothetical protein
MSWQDVLKIQILDVKFDAYESCCSQLKTEYSMFIEKLVEYYAEKLGHSREGLFEEDVNGMKDYFLSILEKPCDVVVGTILHMIDEVKKPQKDSNFPTWGLAELEKMIDNFEKCTGGKAK